MTTFIILIVVAVLALAAMAMADLAAHNDNLIYTPRADTNSFKIADAQTVYRGGLVGGESGYCDDWADGASDLFLGLCIGGDDFGRAAGAAAGTLTGDIAGNALGIPEALVLTGGVTLRHLSSVLDEGNAALVAADVFSVVYATSSNPDDIGMSSSSRNHPVGVITRFRAAADVDVTLFSMMEAAAQRTA